MSLLVLPIPLALPGAPGVPSAGREIWGSPSPPWHGTGPDQHPPAALPPQGTAPPPAPGVTDPHRPLLRGHQSTHEVKQEQKSVCKGRVYRRRLSSGTPMTFRRGRRCQRTQAHAVSFMLPLLPGASNARLGSAPTPCRTVCPPWLAPLATLWPHCGSPRPKNRAHLQLLPGHAVPPHLPGLSARCSVLRIPPVALRSLQAPGSHPCPFLPPFSPLCSGVAGGGALPAPARVAGPCPGGASTPAGAPCRGPAGVGAPGWGRCTGLVSAAGIYW